MPSIYAVINVIFTVDDGQLREKLIISFIVDMSCIEDFSVLFHIYMKNTRLNELRSTQSSLIFISL